MKSAAFAWQALQFEVDPLGTGMWFAGYEPAPVKVVVEVWQSEHSPEVGCCAPELVNAGRVTTGGEPMKLLPAS